MLHKTVASVKHTQDLGPENSAIYIIVIFM
jgi:hypothetical protein